MSQGPEMWINEPGDDDSPSGGAHSGGSGNGSGPDGSGGRGQGRGGMRWIALVAGFAVLIAVIAAQHYLGGRNSDTAPPNPTTGQSVTPPATTSKTVITTPRTASSSADNGSSRASATGGSSANDGTSSTDDQSELTDSRDASSEPATTTPVTTTVEAALPDSAGWEVVGLQGPDDTGMGRYNVIRYQPESGQIVTTPIPALDSNGPLSFVVTDTAAIIRPYDFVAGYLVEDGEPATTLEGMLKTGGGVWPGPDGHHAWVQGVSPDHDGSLLVAVDDHGKKTGATVTVPQVIGQLGGSSYLFGSDGAGYVLFLGIGGTYDLRPDGTRLVTHGQVLAVGPTVLLVYECTDAAVCSAAAVDQSTGAKSSIGGIEGVTAALGYIARGITSPDGRYAAIVEGTGSSITLIDMTTGAMQHLSLKSHVAGMGMPSKAPLAFTPSSSYLLVATASGVVPIDTATGEDLDPLPLPPLGAIAIRPAS